MDRERQEPTFSAPDVTDLQFRSDRVRQISRETRGPPWGYIAAGVVVTILIAMGLIEWNVRRQAAAITAELTRPMTKAEQAKFDADVAKLNREAEAEARAFRRSMEQALDTMPAYAAPNPLRTGERCIGGKRLQRIEGGWRDVPNDPC
ncbi:hypothetical protein [Stenotrophomonas sp. JAI102]|uniref:hypothetical protein n=1 Tax=Stenotrophomonas sp. JAI102 TaxID=2723077 RepID=UPI0015CA0A54|nr:hypothetical protein [Stenotrophomonas sp. JAI102]NYF35099.1 hypothetical protein [Stenotrophomonas sp. JAI102]